MQVTMVYPRRVDRSPYPANDASPPRATRLRPPSGKCADRSVAAGTFGPRASAPGPSSSRRQDESGRTPPPSIAPIPPVQRFCARGVRGSGSGRGAGRGRSAESATGEAGCRGERHSVRAPGVETRLLPHDPTQVLHLVREEVRHDPERDHPEERGHDEHRRPRARLSRGPGRKQRRRPSARATRGGRRARSSEVVTDQKADMSCTLYSSLRPPRFAVFTPGWLPTTL